MTLAPLSHARCLIPADVRLVLRSPQSSQSQSRQYLDHRNFHSFWWGRLQLKAGRRQRCFDGLSKSRSSERKLAIQSQTGRCWQSALQRLNSGIVTGSENCDFIVEPFVPVSRRAGMGLFITIIGSCLTAILFGALLLTFYHKDKRQSVVRQLTRAHDDPN